ncbi:uncharacterized protein A1O9_03116 [Exophiala aquamarina CBS 119918]|uniref:Rab proteins geranylgeranyltransferase n=1 Tax=Exophiala aquamarina CBS 119918 TaxID=1182545 RepID=A0A072PN74_9EURO|nr:uncharacterized protein A1O9_03116 [Exophiala aquamarina CBS 119918]KEF61549.1 hypothetical protein A1O9_03116 [Exophiala aquamarina CBS 119918]
METLGDEIWDVVIAGTSIPQSLLALSLSRSGKKILHVDRHDYYGGDDAGLSLQDVERWVQELDNGRNSLFKCATVSTPAPQSDHGKLASSRSYTLSLNPQIVYAQSAILPALVSSRIHTQLEFLAVGSWWIHRAGTLHKIPSTREDVFNDESLPMKDKRGLMKFLRYILQEEEDQTADTSVDSHFTLQTALAAKFKLSESLQAPLQALALSPLPASLTRFDTALIRIRRHMRSMGYFGPGFGAVIAKYGGNSEISQVACRAGAVGGSVYLLGHELRSLTTAKGITAANTNENADQTPLIECVLSGGTQIRAKIVVGSADDLPQAEDKVSAGDCASTWRSINIVADPLRQLFPQTAENGPTPAVAIVLVEAGGPTGQRAPIYLQIHSEDTGECPSGQCIIYASVADPDSSARQSLQTSVSEFVATCGASDSIIWSLSYAVSDSQQDHGYSELSPRVFSFAPRPCDTLLDDPVLVSVKGVWKSIQGADAQDDLFLRFEERESEADND